MDGTESMQDTVEVVQGDEKTVQVMAANRKTTVVHSKVNDININTFQRTGQKI